MDHRRLSLVVGIFVVASLAVGGLALLSLGQRSGLLQPRYRLVTYFENVQGLVGGAPLRLAGKDVGRVEFVTFAPLGHDVPPVRVVLQLDADVKDRIRSDSVASIGTIGLLGDKYVEISMGTPDGRVLEPGEEMASVSPLDLEVAIVRGTQAIDNVATLAENVNRVVQEFRDTMGARGVAEAASGVADTTRSLAEIVDEVKEGEGLLHSLIYDDYERSGVESIQSSLAALEEVLQEVAHGDGLLHQLVYGTGSEAESLRQALEALERVNAILAKVDGGTGTLGLLVNDPTLYHDLKVLVGGAQRSLIVRSLVRMATGEEPE